jgi:hypothetical protein
MDGTTAPSNHSNPDINEQLRTIVSTAFVEAPSLYTNGFVNGLGQVDAYLVLQANGRSVAVINMPLPVAKSLGQSLLAMIAALEEQTGETIRTLDELRP